MNPSRVRRQPQSRGRRHAVGRVLFEGVRDLDQPGFRLRVAKNLQAWRQSIAIHPGGSGAGVDGPVNVWACGDTATTVRDILQQKLPGLGCRDASRAPDPPPPPGCQARACRRWSRALGLLHRSGGLSVVGFKGDDQRREAFQGTA